MIHAILAGPPDLEKYFLDGLMTYHELHSMAAGIASTQTNVTEFSLCVASEDKGIIAAALLSALAGGPVVVLPPSLSPGAIAETCHVSGATKILCDNGVRVPDGIEPLSHDYMPHSGIPAIAGLAVLDSPVVKLFTGGSTGKPKIWSKNAWNLLAEARNIIDFFAINDHDRILSTVPPYHIYGLLFSVLVPLMSSASALDGTYVFQGDILSAAINNGATILVSVPMHYRIMTEVSSLRNVIRLAFSSAGMLDEKDSLRFYEQTGTGVNEVFGSTETGGIAHRNRGAGETLFSPFPIVDCRIDDDIVTIRSPFLSAELSKDSEGYYRTGDRARAKDGCFELLGRADGIVKVGGKRVDINEVREKLIGLKGIRDVFVTTVEKKGTRGNDIVAIVEADIDERGIRSAAAEMLEPWAVPRRILRVQKIPVTHTGKIDREEIQRILK